MQPKMTGEYLEKPTCKSPNDHLLFWMSTSLSVIGTSPRNAGGSGSQKTDSHPLHSIWYPELWSSESDPYLIPVCKNFQVSEGERRGRRRERVHSNSPWSPSSCHFHSRSLPPGGLSQEPSQNLWNPRAASPPTGTPLVTGGKRPPQSRLWRRNRRCPDSKVPESRPSPAGGSGKGTCARRRRCRAC